MIKQIRFEKLFLKEVLFTPLNPIRFIDELVVQLKNKKQQCCLYKRVSGQRKKRHSNIDK